MSIYAYLHKEHENIRSIMNSIAVLGDASHKKRIPLFNHLKESLILHSKAEEKAFYRPLKKFKSVKEEVVHGKEEHQEAEQLLEELTDENLNGAAWQQKFLKLKDAVEHHIKEEETEIFKDAQKVIDKDTADAMEVDMQTEETHQQIVRDIKRRSAH